MGPSGNCTTVYGESREVEDADRLLVDLLERHAIGSICLDGEIAIPHARSRAVSRFVLGVGRSHEGIDFGDGHSSIRQQAVRDRLLAAASDEEFLRMWDGSRVDLKRPLVA